MNYPDDATLIARGQYSTLTAERRECLRRLRTNAEALAENGRRILRDLEEMAFAGEQIELVAEHAADARQIIKRISELDNMRDVLRSAAWGNQKDTE